MKTSVINPHQSGAVFGFSPSSVAVNPPESAVVTLATSSPMPSTQCEEMAHMRRRLFRTLEHPDRCMIAIDCGAVSIDQIKKITDHFFDDEPHRENHNLVLAIPTDDAFARSPAFDLVQSIKQSAFENHHDGKVSWLLIHQCETELDALANLVRQQGGQWYGE